MHITDSESHQICCEMNMDNSLWHIQNQVSAGGMIIPVICAAKETHITYFLGDHYA